MGFVLEMNLGLLQLAEALDEAKSMRVDQDVGDSRVLQQRLDRAITGHFVDDLCRKDLELTLIERNLLSANVSRHIGRHLFDQLFARQLLQHRKIELVDDPSVQLELLVEQRRALLDQILVDGVRFGIVGRDGSQPRLGWGALRCPEQETHGSLPLQLYASHPPSHHTGRTRDDFSRPQNVASIAISLTKAPMDL